MDQSDDSQILEACWASYGEAFSRPRRLITAEELILAVPRCSPGANCWIYTVNQTRIKQARLLAREAPDADWMLGWDASGQGYLMHLREPRFLAKASLTDDGSFLDFSYFLLLDGCPTRGELMTLLQQAELAWKAWRDDWQDYDA